MKYFENYLFRYSQFFCLLVWAPQLLLFHTCSYGIFVGCWLYSLSAACIHMCHSCYSICLMEMLLWSSRIISVLDDIKQDGAVPVPQYQLYCGAGTDGWEHGVGFVCIFHGQWISAELHCTLCVFSTPNIVLCDHETCVAPFDSDMHLEKGNVSSAHTVFGGGGMCPLFSSCVFCLCPDSGIFPFCYCFLLCCCLGHYWCCICCY